MSLLQVLHEFAVAFDELFADLAKALSGGGAKPAARTQSRGMECAPPDVDHGPGFYSNRGVAAAHGAMSQVGGDDGGPGYYC